MKGLWTFVVNDFAASGLDFGALGSALIAAPPYDAVFTPALPGRGVAVESHRSNVIAIARITDVGVGGFVMIGLKAMEKREWKRAMGEVHFRR